MLAALAGCHALLDIDDVAFGDGTTAAGTGEGGFDGGAEAGGQAPGGAGGVAGSGGAGASGGGQGGGVLGPWGAATLVTEVSDATADDDDPAFTADLLELYVNSDRAGAGDYDIFVSTRGSTAEPWAAPVPVTELNSTSNDTDIAIAPDGLTLWFCSNRLAGLDIFVSRRADRSAPWSTPTAVSELNSTAADCPCAVTDDGLTMVLESRQGGTWNLYLATRASTASTWDTPAALAEVNSTSDDMQGWLSPDGLHLYFDSQRGGGSADLFVTNRPDASSPFEPPTPENGLNTAVIESDPWLAPDRRTILFSRGEYGTRNIYEAHR